LNLVAFFKKESVVSATPIIIMSSIAGIANASILFIINSVAGNISHEDLNFKYLMLFVTAFLIFLIGKNYSLNHACVIIEKMLAKVRIRILDKTRKADLKLIEDIGQAEIHTKLTHNVNTISETALMAVAVCQYGIMLFICSLYIAWLSLPAFIGSAALLSMAVLYFNKKRNEAYVFLKESIVVQETFFKKISGMVLGFKELKINKNRNDAYFADVKDVAHETEDLMVQTQLNFVSGMLLSEVTFYSLLACIVFLMPRLGADYADKVPQLITSVLFIMGPIVTIVAAMPMITRANVSISEIYGLEQKLDDAYQPGNTTQTTKFRFHDISLENVIFHYKDQYENTLFTLDNVNLQIKKGELLFIVGGNGSGKSTILKILTGLYYPHSGSIRLNGKLIDRSNYQSYRELYSIIFTDFHLFEKLYGLDIIDHDKIQYYLEKMELEDKTSFDKDRFTNSKLSTGQMKRLAMITALLFDSEIYVFDELAADQAPEFRKYFYEIILKELQKQGKTIIVVSHDDRYFHVADRVIKMEYGKFSKGSE
jgi:putative ATP-binding cassette transporter